MDPLRSTPIQLNYVQARDLLKTLKPESEDHHQLQTALMHPGGIFKPVLKGQDYLIYTGGKDGSLSGGFASFEHKNIGEHIKLPGLSSNTDPLIKLGSMGLTFAIIVYLAGDFYGVPGKPIVLGNKTEEEKEKAFLAAFETLSQADPKQVEQIKQLINQENREVTHCSSSIHKCYSKEMMSKNNEIAKIKPDSNDLLTDNSDHFANNAIEAFWVGHRLAIRIAAAAKGDLEQLKLAFAIEAFANHFLTDLYSSGHVRNQRGEMETFLLDNLKMSDPQHAKQLAGLLTGAQHEKDGESGLWISSEAHKTPWMAYGDGYLLEPKSETNQQRVIEAVQAGVDEVYEAYNKQQEIKSKMARFFPKVCENNPKPLYELTGNFSPNATENEIKERTLHLYLESEKIAINTIEEFLPLAILISLSHISFRYIIGYIEGVVERSTYKLGSTIFRQHPLIDHSAENNKKTKEELQQIRKWLSDKLPCIKNQLEQWDQRSKSLLKQLHCLNRKSPLSKSSVLKHIKEGLPQSYPDIKKEMILTLCFKLLLKEQHYSSKDINKKMEKYQDFINQKLARHSITFILLQLEKLEIYECAQESSFEKNPEKSKIDTIYDRNYSEVIQHAINEIKSILTQETITESDVQSINNGYKIILIAEELTSKIGKQNSGVALRDIFRQIHYWKQSNNSSSIKNLKIFSEHLHLDEEEDFKVTQNIQHLYQEALKKSSKQGWIFSSIKNLFWWIFSSIKNLFW